MIALSEKLSLTKKTCFMVVAIIFAVTLPECVHILGRIMGVGANIGKVLLPMYFAILCAGVFGGSMVGLLVGLVAPLLSYALTGMPSETILPFMMIELITLGAVGGLMAKTKINNFAKIVIAVIFSKLVKMFFVAIFANFSVMVVVNDTFIGLIGILLQIAILPLLMKNSKND